MLFFYTLSPYVLSLLIYCSGNYCFYCIFIVVFLYVLLSLHLYCMLLCFVKHFVTLLRHYKNTVVIIIVITLIIIMSAPLPESLSPEALLRLGLLGVEPEVPGAGSGGRRWGVLPFRRLADESWRIASNTQVRTTQRKILQPRSVKDITCFIRKQNKPSNYLTKRK